MTGVLGRPSVPTLEGRVVDCERGVRGRTREHRMDLLRLVLADAEGPLSYDRLVERLRAADGVGIPRRTLLEPPFRDIISAQTPRRGRLGVLSGLPWKWRRLSQERRLELLVEMEGRLRLAERRMLDPTAQTAPTDAPEADEQRFPKLRLLRDVLASSTCGISVRQLRDKTVRLDPEGCGISMAQLNREPYRSLIRQQSGAPVRERDGSAMPERYRRLTPLRCIQRLVYAEQRLDEIAHARGSALAKEMRRRFTERRHSLGEPRGPSS